MATDPLLVVAEELYGLSPAEFTGTRNQWAKQTKAEDAALASRIAELRKPSTAAWVVNALMRHQGEQMTQLLDLGAGLRQAQADLDADSLRELTRQRRQLTAAVTQQGRALAADLGHQLTDAVADQVQATLHAAMVDEHAATAVRSGLLVTALSSTGVGDGGAADVADAVAVPSAIGMTARARSRPQRAATPVRERPALRVVGGASTDGGQDADETVAAEADERARRAEEEAAEREARLQRARDELEAATDGADEAEVRLRKARRRVDKVAARTLQTADELDQARRRIAELEHDLETLDDEAASARARQQRAETTAARAGEVVAEARQALERLQEEAGEPDPDLRS